MIKRVVKLVFPLILKVIPVCDKTSRRYGKFTTKIKITLSLSAEKNNIIKKHFFL